MKKIFGVIVTLTVVFTIAYFVSRKPDVSVVADDRLAESAKGFQAQLVELLNMDDVAISVAGNDMSESEYDLYISDGMKLMAEGDFLRNVIGCSLLEYPDGTVILMKGDNKIAFNLGSKDAVVNDSLSIDLGSIVYKNAGSNKIYIPVDNIAKYIDYSVYYDLNRKWVDMAREGEEKMLPESYDMRDYGRVTAVRDQGKYGTCWAFASLGALESALMPLENSIFSTDHMTLSNSFKLGQDMGGEHCMSIAYLAAWQGPVYEVDDPYGDGETNTELSAVKHLEEAIVMNERNMDTIKSAIFRYGGIETSLYSQMLYSDSESMFYQRDNAAYYYNGDETPNHDVVVVGWDDNYPKENFSIEPEGNGAFICKNSWGTEFGEDGYFYVSYYDKNICNKSVVYTKVGEADNYDNIYQSDLLGWIGQIGFGKEESFFANAYTTKGKEKLCAVSFYATGDNTEFEIYVVRNFEGQESLKDKEFVVAGSTKYSGYYTVDLPEEIILEKGTKYAVVVKVKTPGVEHPIAIEYYVDERTENFDLSDGEGYISLYGETWHSSEKKENCNVCLKAFTKNVQ